MAAFNNKYRDKAIYEQELILSEMPVPLASDITYTLYGKYISVSSRRIDFAASRPT